MVQSDVLHVIGAIGAIIALSGCLTVGMGVDSTVGSDGVIERYELQMNVSGQGYTMMKTFGQTMGGNASTGGGFEDLEEQIRENVTEEFASVGEVETNVTETTERLTLTVVLHDAVPAEGGNITVSTEGDRVVYRDATFNRSYDTTGASFGGGSGADGGGDDTDDGSGLERDETGMGNMMDQLPEPELRLRYRLEMPGEIRDSNADATEGNVARWNRTYTGDELDEAGLVVEAESGTGGGGMPGFGVAAAVAALLAGAALVVRRRR